MRNPEQLIRKKSQKSIMKTYPGIGFDMNVTST